MKKINRLVLYLASGLLIGEIFYKNSIEIIWGFILVPGIIVINIISRRKKSDCAILCLLFVLSVFIGEKLYENKKYILEQCDAVEGGEIVNISGEVVNIWDNADGISVEMKREYDGVKILCYFDDFDYKIGSLMEIRGENKKIDVATNYGEFDVKEYYNSKEIFLVLNDCNVVKCSNQYSEILHSVYLARGQLKKAILEICDKEEAGVLCAMLFGDKEYLDTEIKELYTMSGIGHILAISGLHISMAGGIVYQIMRKYMRQPAAFLISSGIMLCFCGISGANVSTVRAVIMYIINIFSHVLGRKYDIKNAMAIAMIYILYDNPLYINNGGFILSFVSVAGIAFALPVIDEVFGEYTSIKGMKIKCLRDYLVVSSRKISGALLTSATLCLTTLIIIADAYYEVPVYSIVLNALLLPLMGIMVISGFLGGVLFYIAGPLGRLVVMAAVIVLRLYKWVCQIFANIPMNTYVTGDKAAWQMVLYYTIFVGVLVVCLAMKRKKCSLKRIVTALSPAVVFMLLLVMWKKEYTFVVSMLDVGQGDCIYVESPDGCNYLIDGGSSDEDKIGQYKIEPYLKSRGRNSLTAVFVTHTDIDHMNGIIEIMESESIYIENLVFGAFMPEENEKYHNLVELANKKGINIIGIKKGDIIGKDGGVWFKCLNPRADYQYEDINAASTVLLGQYKEYKFMLTGDIGKNEEKLVAEGGYDNDIRDLLFLKVAHHGSKNSSCDEFVKLVKPKLALISCGLDNAYGHPADETVDRLVESGAKVLVTTECGQIIVEEIGGDIVIHSYKSCILT